MSLTRQLAAEALGTAFLLAAVIGSGIMGEKLGGGNMGVALLANSIATGCALAGLIVIFAGVSGAHFNPVVTLWAWLEKKIAGRAALGYIAAQLLGAFAGVAAAHIMFGLPVIYPSVKIRSGLPLCFSEVLATFGLVLVIAACARQKTSEAPFVISAYIAAAYWFTASTAFANPAVTLARSMSNTFAGIRFADTGGFMVAQVIGAVLATYAARWLWPET